MEREIKRAASILHNVRWGKYCDPVCLCTRAVLAIGKSQHGPFSPGLPSSFSQADLGAQHGTVHPSSVERSSQSSSLAHSCCSPLSILLCPVPPFFLFYVLFLFLRFFNVITEMVLWGWILASSQEPFSSREVPILWICWKSVLDDSLSL